MKTTLTLEERYAIEFDAAVKASNAQPFDFACVVEFIVVMEGYEPEPEFDYPEFEADEAWPVESADDRSCRLAENAAQVAFECHGGFGW